MIESSEPGARQVFLRRAFPFVLLILIPILLIGCQPLIEVVQPAPGVGGLDAATAVATVAPDARGVAIMGIDFDPPLEAGQLLLSGGVTLLVAVENDGQAVEPSVRVTARLYDPEVAGKSGDLAHETVIVKSLDAGELQVVRFTQVTDLPVRERYKLLVEVAPVPGERDLANNVKTYEILVRAQ